MTNLKISCKVDCDSKISMGSGNANAKLIEGDVIVIKIFLSHSIPIKTIADKYKVHPNTIRAIESGKRWKHVRVDNRIQTMSTYSVCCSNIKEYYDVSK